MESAWLVLTLRLDLRTLFLHKFQQCYTFRKLSVSEGHEMLLMSLCIMLFSCWLWNSGISWNFVRGIELSNIWTILVWKTTYCTRSTKNKDQTIIEEMGVQNNMGWSTGVQKKSPFLKLKFLSYGSRKPVTSPWNKYKTEHNLLLINSMLTLYTVKPHFKSTSFQVQSSL